MYNVVITKMFKLDVIINQKCHQMAHSSGDSPLIKCSSRITYVISADLCITSIGLRYHCVDTVQWIHQSTKIRPLSASRGFTRDVACGPGGHRWPLGYIFRLVLKQHVAR